MAYSVAHAEVTVVPGARGFGEALRAQITPEAERIGREAGEKIADGIRDRVRVALAKLPDANIDLDLDTAGATAQVDSFLVDTKAKAAVAGDDAGRSIGRNMADGAGNGFKARSALIGTAVGLGLAAAAPLAVAGAGILFGGLAAVILHNQDDVSRAASELGKTVTATYGHMAQTVVPMLTSALGQVQRAAVQMAPAIGQVFKNLGPAIQGVTDGVIGLVRNALPGLAAAIQKGTPVFQGLADFMEKIGTGISDLFTIISAHAGAVGAAFSAFGDVIKTLLQVIGELASAGAELGQTMLPLLASALGGVADALHVIQPILPEVLSAFLAYKAVGLLSGPVEAFGKSLGKLAASDIPGIARAAGAAKTAVGAFGQALPVIGIALGVYGAAFVHSQDQVHSWANALAEGGAAARAANKEMASSPSAWDRFSFAVAHGGSTLGMTTAQARAATAEYKKMLAQMSPLEREQSLAAKAQNDLSDALARHDTKDASKALAEYNTHTAVATHLQEGMKAQIDGTTIAFQQNATRLQGLANAASAADSQVNLLKGALDALTGKAVTMDQAEIQVTQAVEAAKNAIKGQTGALVTANGQLDLHSAKGAAAAQALINLASTQHNEIAVMEQQGKTSAQVGRQTDVLRGQFIATARQMGFNASQAQALANKYFGIPKNVNTEIKANTAQADAAIVRVKNELLSIKDRTVYVRTVTSADGSQSVHRGVAAQQAMGGIVHAFAGGGFESMSAGTAQVVPPNTWRVIGDRISDDEAYIPINNSARSLEILAQTANRMGFGLERGSVNHSSSKTDARSYHWQIAAGPDAKAIAREMRAAQIDLEFLHG